MAFGFREYLKAEILTELLSQVFLGGKHPRFIAFLLLFFLGLFFIVRKLFHWIFRLIYLLCFGFWRDHSYESLQLLKKPSRGYRDSLSSITLKTDNFGAKWWHRKVVFSGSQEGISFFAKKDTGELIAFFEAPGRLSEPIGLSGYLREAERFTSSRLTKEVDAVGEVYRYLRSIYRPGCQFQ